MITILKTYFLAVKAQNSLGFVNQLEPLLVYLCPDVSLVSVLHTALINITRSPPELRGMLWLTEALLLW